MCVPSADARETVGDRQVAVLSIDGAENQSTRSMEADPSDYFIYSLCHFLFIKAIRVSFRKLGSFREAVEQSHGPSQVPPSR